MLRLFWLGPLVLLQACAGTPVAERLERSFAATPSEMSSSGANGSPPAAPSSAVAAPESSGAADASEQNAATKKDLTKQDTPKKETPKKDTTKEDRTKEETTKEDSAPTSPAISEPSTPLRSVVAVEEAEPYRITIRLSGADPSAPAEAVTRALRNADVRFAVERIERIQP